MILEKVLLCLEAMNIVLRLALSRLCRRDSLVVAMVIIRDIILFDGRAAATTKAPSELVEDRRGWLRSAGAINTASATS
jgi:hypothetical protein